MEHEAKQNLLARLDECLLEHAKALSSGDGMPDIADVYKLQDLSELHYYLKVEHVFTPAEVEALLQFKDPLDVARWCKEENTHKHSFPICELLQEIKAYQRFPLSDASVARQKEVVEQLKATLDRNYTEFYASLIKLDTHGLIEQSRYIADVQEAYRYLRDHFQYGQHEAAALLSLQNPLKYIADNWLSPVSEVFDVDADIRDNIAEIGEHPEYPRREETPAAPSQEKPSLHDRLQNAARKAAQHPAPEGKPRDDGAR